MSGQFDGRGFENEKFGYLPESLKNDFIAEGHNRYAEQKAAVKTARQGLQSARKAGRQEARSTKKAAFEKEHPVVAARRELRGSVKAVRKAGGDVAAAKQHRRDVVGAARQNPESAGQEKFVRGQVARAKRAAKKPTVESGGGYST